LTRQEDEVVRYRMARAREAIDEAWILLDAGHVNTYVNRLYYACYYAVSGLLATRDLLAARHARVRALLHQEFVKPGKLPVNMGQHFDRLFDNRQKGDYADFTHFRFDEVEGWLPETVAFVDAVEALLAGDTRRPKHGNEA